MTDCASPATDEAEEGRGRRANQRLTEAAAAGFSSGMERARRKSRELVNRTDPGGGSTDSVAIA